MMRIFTGLAAIAALATPVLAKVARIPLAELWKTSEVIVVAQVVKIQSIEGVKIARAKVQTIYRGHSATQFVHFIAEPTWTCDSSTAIKGERVLLFLSSAEPSLRQGDFVDPFHRIQQRLRSEGIKLYKIAHSGSGREPVVQRGGLNFIEVFQWSRDKAWGFGNVDLPKSIAIRPTGSDKGLALITGVVPKQKP